MAKGQNEYKCPNCGKWFDTPVVWFNPAQHAKEGS